MSQLGREVPPRVSEESREEEPSGSTQGGVSEKPPLPRRFHGSVQLDPLRLGAEAGRIGEEVIAHLQGLPGARVQVSLEITALVPNGFDDRVVRTVT